MSIEGLFDHRAEVWRLTETRGRAGDVVQTPTQVDDPTTGLNCAAVPPGLTLENIGPGEATRGRVELYLHRLLDVQARDVVRLLSGPEAPSTWRVLSVARPRGHHIEAGVEPWIGKLPEEES